MTETNPKFAKIEKTMCWFVVIRAVAQNLNAQQLELGWSTA